MIPKKLKLALMLGGLALGTSSLAQAPDPNEMALQYRQALMTLVGQNFGPMAAMVKGDIPWDGEKFQAMARDLSLITSINIMRGFRPGSEVGKTHAKPSIWQNMPDFENQMRQFTVSTGELAAAAQSGDKAAIMAAFQDTGGKCKACHDDYKSKDYLNQ